MKDRRVVAIMLAVLAIFLFYRAWFAYWVLNNIAPIFKDLPTPDNDPEWFILSIKNLHFSIALFSVLGLTALASAAGVFLQQRWARWVWLVSCTVMSFSYLFNLLIVPGIAIKQLDFLGLCIISWVLLRGNGLARASAP